MAYYDYLLHVDIINKKFISICFENKKCNKKEFKNIKCLIPIEQFNMKYEQNNLLIGSNGQFYYSIDAGENGYDTAQDWYDLILSKLSCV